MVSKEEERTDGRKGERGRKEEDGEGEKGGRKSRERDGGKFSKNEAHLTAAGSQEPQNF